MANKNERTPNWVLEQRQESEIRKITWVAIAVCAGIFLALWLLNRGGL